MNSSKNTKFIVEVYAKPNSSSNSVVWDDLSKHYIIKVNDPPEKGKANKQILKLLKDYFKAKKINLVKGSTSSTKLFEIIDGIRP